MIENIIRHKKYKSKAPENVFSISEKHYTRSLLPSSLLTSSIRKVLQVCVCFHSPRHKSMLSRKTARNLFLLKYTYELWWLNGKCPHRLRFELLPASWWCFWGRLQNIFWGEINTWKWTLRFLASPQFLCSLSHSLPLLPFCG